MGDVAMKLRYSTSDVKDEFPDGDGWIPAESGMIKGMDD